MLGTIAAGLHSGRRALDIGRGDGLATLARKIPPFCYQQLHPSLPTSGHVELNGVETAIEKRVLDDVVPRALKQYVWCDDPRYEDLYVGCLRTHVDRGETVVAVGGGEGVSTVALARQVGRDGRVCTFEGGAAQVERCHETVAFNGVSDRVTVEHAIISTDYSLRSARADAGIVDPTELPVCDTLAIDADGAEIPILEGLHAVDPASRPGRLVVEHHAVLDDGTRVLEYQPERVRDSIRSLGYDIVEERADPERAYGRLEERIVVAEQ